MTSSQEKITSAQQLLDKIIKELSPHYKKELRVIRGIHTHYYNQWAISQYPLTKFLGIFPVRKDLLRLTEEIELGNSSNISYLEARLLNIKEPYTGIIKDLIAKYVRDNHIIHWVIT